MSTTNPPAGGSGHQPGAGPGWPGDARHGGRADDHGGGGGVDPAALKAGHEPDAFAVKPLMSVPLAVVATFVIAFSVAAGAFYFYDREADRPEPFAHPDAVAQNEKPLNDQLLEVGRAGMWKGRPEYDQPRLEPLRRLEGNGKFFVHPPLPNGNSPEIHWEDIRPDRVPALQTTGYADHDKKFAHIPIGDAMRLAVESKQAFPAEKAVSKPVGTDARPSASSAGRGTQPPYPQEPTAKDEKKGGAGKGADAKEPTKKDTQAPKTPEPAPKPPEKK